MLHGPIAHPGRHSRPCQIDLNTQRRGGSQRDEHADREKPDMRCFNRREIDRGCGGRFLREPVGPRYGRAIRVTLAIRVNVADVVDCLIVDSGADTPKRVQLRV